MSDEQSQAAFYATATWVNLFRGKPEQSYTRYLTILCISTEGFSGLLADSKYSTKDTWGSALVDSRKKFCDLSSVTPSMVGYVRLGIFSMSSGHHTRRI